MKRLLAGWAVLALLAPAGGEGAVPAVATGGWHSLALHADGTVRSWGDDSSGSLGVGRSLFSTSPLPVPGLAGMTAVSAGAGHTVALRGDGTVWAWGSNQLGELGDGSFTSRSTPAQVVGLSGVTRISAGNSFNLALKSDGTVWAWGSNYFGQQGDEEGHRSLAHPIEGLSGIVEISAGAFHALARRGDGAVLAWGLNGDGQLGDGTRLASYEGRARPVQVGLPRDVVQVSAGGWHSLARTSDGNVWAWGANDLGQAGDGSKGDPKLRPVQVGLANIAEISAGYAYSLARAVNGGVWAWGGGGYGQLGDGLYEDRPSPVQLAALADVSQLAAGFVHSAALRSDGGLFVWGYNNNGQLGLGVTTPQLTPLVVPGLGNLSGVAVGGYHTVALRRDGVVLTWGDNSFGQLGNGVFTFRATPQAVPDLNNVTAVGAGYRHSLALTADGRVYAWGSNDANQLTGEGIGRSSPAPIQGLANVRQISAGVYHSLALLDDGTVRAFGSNYRGRLGTGNPEDSGPLATVANLTGVRQVSAGGGHSLALRQDLTVWSWGENDAGQLGDGTTTDRYGPVRVTGLADVVEVVAGPAHSLARKADGTVWTWGNNVVRQYQDGTPEFVTAPVRVEGLPRVSSIAAGRDFSFALADGTVWVWGVSYSGALGCGECDARPLPVQVPGLTRIRAIGASQTHVLALRDDGSVYAFGAGQLGELGDGTLIDRNAPVVVLHEGGTGSVVGNDWFLDLDPAVPSSVPAEKVPIFLVATRPAGSDIAADLRPRPQDVGASASLFVFALAPATAVKGAAAEIPGIKAKSASRKDTPVACVLAQLNASGQLVGVNVASLQAAVTGVLSAQGASVNILNGTPAANAAGATFFVGYGATPAGMMSAGTNRGVVSVPGAVQCKPESPQTGWWWNPAEDGRGFSIEQRGNNLFFASFLYDVSGRSTWYVSTGAVSLDGALYQGDLLSARNGQTLAGAYTGFPALRSEGTVTLAFNTASTGTLVWPGGTVPIRRFDIVPNGAVTGPAADAPESGWWWNDAEPGRGFFMEWQGSTLDIAGYMYDDAGNSVWYLTVGTMGGAGGRTFSGNWWSYGNGQTLTGAWKPNTRLSDNVAPVTITFSGTDTALMTLPNGRTTALRRHRF